jgi:hypothetical protein
VVVIGKLVWAALSTALAFGVNWQMAPVFHAAYELSEPRSQAGTLRLKQDGAVLEIASLSAHVVMEEVKHLDKTYAIRELSLRSLAPASATPSFELFLSLPVPLAAGPGGVPALRGAELVVRQTGRLGARESFVKRQQSEPGRVLAGSVVLTDISEIEGAPGQAPGYQADARLELQVETARGIDMVTGRWNGRLLW